MDRLKILIACEESQAITLEFRARGHEAYSCDLQECSGGAPQWHVKGDVLALLTPGGQFTTQDGTTHEKPQKWDLIIAHPPCTYMSKAGARWMYPKAGQISPERLALAMEARDFYYVFRRANCDHVAIENPVPLKVVNLPKETQKVQPYEYGDPYSKATLLWIKGLPRLKPTNVLSEYQPWMPSNTGGFAKGQKGSRGVAHDAKTASKTFPGIARAIADQWGGYLMDLKEAQSNTFND